MPKALPVRSQRQMMALVGGLTTARGHAEHDDRFQLLGEYGLAWIDAQRGRGQVIEQGRQLGVFGSGRNGIPETDIPLDQAIRRPQSGPQVHPQAVVPRRFPDLADAKVPEFEDQAVIGLKPAEFVDDGFDPRRVRGAKAEEVGIARRAVFLVEPMPKKHGALEQEVIPVARDRQPIQQALDGIAVERQLELLPCLFRAVQQSLADRIDSGWRGLTHATDSR